MTIPIIPPEAIPSREKRFLTGMIEYIEEIEIPYEQRIIFFDVMVEGSKLLLDEFSEFEKDLEWYHANIKVSYVLGFRSALDKFNEILDYLSTYASGENIEQYFDLYMIGVNIIQNIIESGEHLPEIKTVIKDIDLLKKGEYINSEYLWNEIKDYVDKMT